MKRYIFFYRTTNIINGKLYYGVHSTDNIDDGYIGCGIKKGNPPKKSFLFHRAVRKYGYENFKMDILIFFNTIEEAYLYEKCYITNDLLKRGDVYNTKLGGEGGKWNLLLRQKHIKLGTYKKTKTTKDKLSLAALNRFENENGTFMGKHHTKESRMKMSMNNVNKGRILSDIEKLEKSKATKHGWQLRLSDPHEKQKWMDHLNHIRQFSFTRALSDQQIEEIKSTYTGKRGQRAILVKQYNISYGILERILGKSFTHIKE